MPENEIKQFAELVVEMRRTQKEFFKSRNYTAMQKSKILEKEVDERASEILNGFNQDIENFSCKFLNDRTGLITVSTLAERLKWYSSKIIV